MSDQRLPRAEPPRAPLTNVFIDHSREALRARFAAEGISPHWAEQVFSWIYRRGVYDLSAMEDLPQDLRERLAGSWSFRTLETKEVQRSVDGTRKLLLSCWDGEVVEAVLIPEARRTTLCVSTQVGCALACSFCATGALGFTRNLSAGEIVDQVLCAGESLEPGETLTNVVFMGMGEPLLNLPAVHEAIRVMTDQRGLALAPRRITVSTSGVIPKIRPLLEIGSINLAVSLHATTDEVRDHLVPLNKRYSLQALMSALRAEERLSRKRPVFFEYTLIEGVNDSLEDARRLPELLKGIPSKLNLIPMNPHSASDYRPPTTEVCDAFAAEVHAAGVRVMLRKNRGRDISAACGQLARRSGAAQPGASLARSGAASR
ncbi:MAG: 23S rRNA (adenine(2503)-C(2))-methyltransferase RlmN [Planctomycetes bacterium]|nr:23S rRNA (adenine(2503)-C(2))-methyltransferase RlmN [Planctomycetota bacterium]